MIDQERWENVINALELCTSEIETRTQVPCEKCHYHNKEYHGVHGNGCCNMRSLQCDILALLKAQEPRVLTLRELAFYDAGIFVETRNGCPEGLTDELWPALGHLYCVSQNGEDGYVSFVNWNADTYDFEAKDYNVDFRCWTARPTDKQREAIPWEG